MNKALVKESLISRWFKKRQQSAIEEYRAVVTGTVNAHYCVTYRGNTFNPLGLTPREMKGIYEVEPNSKEADALDRYIRIMDDMHKVTGILTYLLNQVNSMAECNYLIFNESFLESTRKDELDKFKELAQDKLSFLRRIRLMADMVK